jgi:Protein of unknown function (DUF3179)
MKYKTGLIAAICIALTAVAVVYIPVHLIQPFKSQTKEAVLLSYYMRTWGPVITIFLFVGALFVCISFFRTAIGRLRKAILVLLLMPVGLATWFAHQNYFQWMFRPLDNPNYAIASKTDFIVGKDMVLAVSMSGDSVAYPVRLLAYHHLVHDKVGGKPILATY